MTDCFFVQTNQVPITKLGLNINCRSVHLLSVVPILEHLAIQLGQQEATLNQRFSRLVLGNQVDLRKQSASVSSYLGTGKMFPGGIVSRTMRILRKSLIQLK
jgi:hypothetical protein